MSVALICTALLGLLLFGLGLAVSLTRGSTRILIGHPADDNNRLHRVVRAHGNTAEYAPFLAVLFLWHGANTPEGWVLALIVAATMSRYLIVVGLLSAPTLSKPHPVRFIGALGTYVCGLALAGAILLKI